MAQTKVDLYNRTLVHLGVNPNIESESEDTKKRIVLDASYNSARKHVLKQHDWSCAKEYFTLVEVGTPPASWAKQYKWPNDMLKPRYLERKNRKSTEIPFTTATYSDADNGRIKVIQTDLSNAVMVGTYNLEEVNDFTIELFEGIAAYLAFLSSHQFTDSSQIKQQAFNFFENMVGMGAQMDANAEAQDEEQSSPWHRARDYDVDPYPEVIRGT